VHHAVLGLGAVELELQDLLVHSVAALVRDACDGALGARRQQDLVVADERVFDDGAEDIAAGDVVSDLVVAGGKVPLLLAVEGGDVDTAGNVDAVGGLGDALERALDTVVDGLEQTGAELDGERLSGPDDRVADRDTSCNGLVEIVTCRHVAYQFPRKPEWTPYRLQSE
jgi:hypothetical protein